MENSLVLCEENTKARTHRQKREKIKLIETRPTSEWFVESRSRRGRQLIYLRFQITGLNTRFYGPFPSRRQALLFLDDVLGNLRDMLAESDTDCHSRIVSEEFQNIYPPIIDSPVLRQLLRG